MTHSFNAYLAEQYDINQAILLNSFAWWHKYNVTNEKNFHDGRYWTYNSVTAFSKQFPYMSQKQIRSALERLEENGLIVTGNYNKHSYDRTKWYALTSKCLLILHEHGILKMDDEQVNTIRQLDNLHLPKSTNGFLQKGEPIPILNPILNTGNKSISTETAEHFEYEIPQERLLVADQDVPYNLSQTAEVNKQQGTEEEPYGVWVNSKEATDYYEQQSRFHPNGRKEKEIEVLLSAQNASNNSSTKKKKREYTPEFEQMWSTYGNKNNKYESFVEYKQLTPEQQAKLIDFIAMYVQVREVKFQKNLDRLIRQEDYESLYESIEQQLRQKPKTTAVVVTDNRAIYC